MRWELEKNKIDMDYQLDLQQFQVILAATYGLPIAVFSLWLQAGLTFSNIAFGILAATVVFTFLKQKQNKIRQSLANHKRKVDTLTV